VRVLARSAPGFDLVVLVVCAIDATWSNLKLVTRRELR
jgi:hypothetical protein